MTILNAHDYDWAETQKKHKITFSHYYSKLPKGDNTAILLDVRCSNINDCSKQFLEYDSKYWTYKDDICRINYYDFKGLKEVLILFFKGEPSGMLFTTIRRDYPEKLEYYHNAIGEEFEIVVKEK